LVDRLGLWVDWDKDAGEAWARLLRGSGASASVAAFVWASGPLGIVSSDAPDQLVSEMRSGNLVVVRAEDFRSRNFCLRPQGIAAAMDDAEWPQEVSPDAMSINDLWWATV